MRLYIELMLKKFIEEERERDFFECEPPQNVDKLTLAKHSTMRTNINSESLSYVL